MKSDGIFCSLRFPDSYSTYRCFIARLNRKIIIKNIYGMLTISQAMEDLKQIKAMKLMELRSSKDLTVFALKCALLRFLCSS